MIDPESMIQLKWGAVTFQLHRDREWHLSWSKKGAAHRSSGPDAAVILADAIREAGLNEETRAEIFAALMHKLRERVFH